jgi:hypothetical protein
MKKTNDAERIWPSWLSGFDTHQTIEDVCHQVRHELDLYEEGEETDMTPKTAALARKFLKKQTKPLLPN